MSADAGGQVMFEIYRAPGATARYRVIYYTELHEDQRDEAIAQALAGQPVVDGFILEQSMPAARATVETILVRLNGGEALGSVEILTELANYLA